MKLHASGEDYLETILVLQKKRGMVRYVDVARPMEVSKPLSLIHISMCIRDSCSCHSTTCFLLWILIIL